MSIPRPLIAVLLAMLAAFIVTCQRGAEWAATGNVALPVPDNFPRPRQT